MALRFFNTASRQTEEFTPPPPYQVRMYHCGPTVYNFIHIGNLRAYFFADILRRTLELNGYSVEQVINITDVGHLVSDGDEGEDKMIVGAAREGSSVEEIIAKYSNAFYEDLLALNIKKASAYPRATAYIEEQKSMIETLHEKGHTYVTNDGIYFDTTTFSRYADLARLDVEGIEAGARVAMGEKKHATDFAVWKFSPSDSQKREQEWVSPITAITHGQMGFPGWHIECSAIIHSILGDTIDIHTGGIDHIPVHHTNEIAQSESAFGVHPFVRYWMHCAFMNVDGQKMSKSLGNTYRLADLNERNFSSLAYRYWLLTAHYRTHVNFTWEALEGAATAYRRLTQAVLALGEQTGELQGEYQKRLLDAINDDLNTPASLAVVWDLLKDDAVSNEDKRSTILFFDTVLGLDLGVKKDGAEIPKEVQVLIEARRLARDSKQFFESDRLRDEIQSLGYTVKDTPNGQSVEKLL